jgi:hypothetical protein
MAILFGNTARKTTRTGPASQLRIQTAIQGTPIPILWGQTRLAANILWYGNFKAAKASTAGGKGGALSGGKAGNSGTYNYSASVVLGLCEGVVSAIGKVWSNKVQTTIAALALSLFGGSYAQTVWSLITSLFSSIAPYSNYRGIAYLAGTMSLGTSPEVPNMNYEVSGPLAGTGSAVSGAPDAAPDQVLHDYLTNVNYGAGFASAWVGDLTTYGQYCLAAGLVISPAIVSQQAANVFLKDLMTATNSDAYWSAGQLKVVPYGDTALAANGASYTPPQQPLYSLGDDDFILSGNSIYRTPVVCKIKRIQDQSNSIKIEYLARNNSYNPSIYEVKNEANILNWGLKPKDTKQLHFFCHAACAAKSAALQLGREQILRAFQFTVGRRFILLEPMDVIAISDPGLALASQWVRITEIQENQDFSLTITAEEYLNGAGEAPVYNTDANAGAVPDYNVPPGNADVPLFFEPPDALAGGLYVYMVVTGGAEWGGCDVYTSTDNQSYALQSPRIIGGGRKGVLTAPLPTATPATSGLTIDTTSVLSVQMDETGELLPGSQADLLALNTLLWVDGELIAYRDVTLTGPGQYAVSYLARGCYGTSIGPHAAGAKFGRVDSGVFAIPYTQDRIGSQIYVKLVSFNVYEGGQQTLADVSASTYTIQGLALSSALPDVKNFRTSYQGTLTMFSWDEVTDFRAVQYEIRQGASWATAQPIGRYAHPPVAAPQGDGTYWIAAWSQPVAGLTVYSANPADVAITGSILTQNIIATHDEQAAGWPGTH